MAFANISDGGLSTILQFTYHTNSQMFSILKKTAAKCPHISNTYSIGRSVEGKDLLVIELLLPGACGMDSTGAHGGLFCIGFDYAIGQGGVA